MIARIFKENLIAFFMKVMDLYGELKEKDFFKKFVTDKPDAFLYAGFFVLNFESGDESFQFDFYLPSENSVEIVEFPFEGFKAQENVVPCLEENVYDSDKMKKLDLNLKVDLDDLKEKVEEVKKENDCAQPTTKLICVLKEGIWNLTSLNNQLGILRIKINSLTGEVVDFNKGSLMEFMGVVKK